MPTLSLRDVEIFRDLNRDELKSVSEILSRTSFERGETVFTEGEPGLDLYIVESGLMEATVITDDGGDFAVARFRPGDFFGEMSIFEDAPRSATCRTREPSTVLSLSKSEFFTLVDRSPGTAIKIMDAMLRGITARLQTTSSLVAQMVQWGENARRRVSMDAATGFFNRGFLDSALPGLYSRTVSLGRPLSLIMLDLDHFREINEAHGHSAGDAVIEAVTPLLSEVYSRDEAVLARYGGDEFAFVLPNTTSDEALELAERARRLVAEHSIQLPKGKRLAVTISQGIAVYPDHASSLEELGRRADEALYAAKEGGRNRSATPPASPESSR